MQDVIVTYVTNPLGSVIFNVKINSLPALETIHPHPHLNPNQATETVHNAGVSTGSSSGEAWCSTPRPKESTKT